MPDKPFTQKMVDSRAGHRLAEAILDYVGHAPPTGERPSSSPATRARAIAHAAARQAAVTTSSLTLPPGPLGWMTLVPELRTLWKLQTQMVADIAACHGRTSELNRAAMLYCLFRHTDPDAVRDLVAAVGKRQVVVERSPKPDTRAVALKIGLHISQRLVGKGISRWLPVLGALGAGAYAYYDTARVARTAIEFFSEPGDPVADSAAENAALPGAATDERPRPEH